MRHVRADPHFHGFVELLAEGQNPRHFSAVWDAYINQTGSLTYSSDLKTPITALEAVKMWRLWNELHEGEK